GRRATRVHQQALRRVLPRAAPIHSQRGVPKGAVGRGRRRGRLPVSGTNTLRLPRREGFLQNKIRFSSFFGAATEARDLGPGGWYTRRLSPEGEARPGGSPVRPAPRPRVPEPPRGAGRGRPPWMTKPPVLPMSEVTRILDAIAQGDPHAGGQLLPLVY